MGSGRERLGQRGCAGLLRPPGSAELQWEWSKKPLPAGRGKPQGPVPGWAQCLDLALHTPGSRRAPHHSIPPSPALY